MLANLFAEVLELSVYGAAAAVVIMLIKLLAGRRLPIQFHKALWLILIIKLLLPYEIPSSVSLNNYFSPVLSADSFLESSGVFRKAAEQHDPAANDDNIVSYTVNHQTGSEEDQSVPITSDKVNVSVPDTVMPSSAYKVPSGIDWMTIAAYIWGAGMLALLLAFLMAYIKTTEALKSNAQQINEVKRNKISKLLEECKQELSCKQNIRVILTSRFSFPFVFGFFRPVVVLPEAFIHTSDEEHVKSILLHEITHIQKHDPLIRFLTAILQAVHWFNPALWAAFSWMAKDCERACDDAVIHEYDDQRRVQYASTLYSLAENQSSRNIFPLLAFGENNIKTRIKDILEHRRYSLLSIIAAVLIVAVAAVSMLTGKVDHAQQPVFEVYVLDKEHASSTARTLLFTHKDILAYDWEQQIIRIRNNGNFKPDLLKKDAEFVVNGEVIYTATFWSPIFSMMPPEIPLFSDTPLFNDIDDEIILFVGRWHLSNSDTISASIKSIIMDERIHDIMIERNVPLVLDEEMTDALSAWNADGAGKDSEKKDSTDSQETIKPVDESEEEVYAKVKFLLDQIVNSGSASSNPHDYINGNEGFKELVSLGEPAMQTMFEMFAEYHEDGLKEYVMAVACAKILGVYDEERGLGIDSGAEWFMKYGQSRLDGLHFIDADYYDFLNTDIIKEEIMLPERTDKTNLEDVLSDYILARKRHAFYMGEKAFEAHHIFRTVETGGVINVYMLVRFAWFEFQNGIFASVSGTGGIPVKMELKKSENGQYEVISFNEPMDGGMWRTSLQEMFPDDLIQSVTQRDNMAQWEKEQVTDIMEQAADYLKNIGREGAPLEYRYVPERLDDGYRKAIYQVTGFRSGFPEWIGSREVLVNAGGPYPGEQIRCRMETNVSEVEEGGYIVTLTRAWDTKINEKQPISIWKYKVDGEVVSMIEMQNMDHLISLMK